MKSFIVGSEKPIAVFLALILAYSCMAMSACGGLPRKSSGYAWEKVLENHGLSLVDSTILDENHIWVVDWIDIDGRTSEILFSKGSTWDLEFSSERMILSDIYALSKDHVWAVGFPISESDDSGLVYYFNGVSWLLDLKIEGEWCGFIAVFALDEGHVWATGKGISFFNGSEWSQQFDSSERLQSICAVKADNAWAVSESGMIYHFDGSAWGEQQQLRFPDERFFISYARMHALDEAHVWAALYDDESEITRIFFFDGSSWEEQLALPRTLVITGIDALDEKHVWASCGGAFDRQYPILFFNGREWSIQEECDESLIGIHALDEKNVLAVGESGSIYKGRKE